MSRQTVDAQSTSRDGLEAVYVAGHVDGLAFLNTGREIVHYKKAAGSDAIVSTQTPQTVDGLAVPSRTMTVTAAEERFLGPFPASYNQSDGKVYMDFDTVTGLTLAVIRLP